MRTSIDITFLTYFNLLLLLIIFNSFLSIIKPITCQIINRPPRFVPGSGDMSKFSLSENTAVGSPIYQLKGKIFYKI